MKYGKFIVPAAILVAIGIWMTRTSSSGISTEKNSVVSEQANSALPKVSPVSSVPPTSEDSAKLQLLEDVLKKKNDNDPRLDKDFYNLTPKMKELFREKYAALPAEQRNEKGTIIFLLGRNLQDPEDFRFLESVLTEAPCYNLGDCKAAAGSVGDEMAHGEMGSEVTLAYPQLVSLKAAEKYLADKNAKRPDLALRIVETGKTSDVRIVSTTADKIFRLANGG